VLSKFRPYIEGGQGQVSHVNMEDIVEDEPDFKDDKLHNQMELERGEWFFDHVWLGAPFHKFAGLPFSEHRVADCDITSVAYAFLDPSFKGGDYTALCFLGENSEGRPCAWGCVFKSAWNMEPALSGCIDALRRYQPNRFYYEDNSLGTVVKNEFQKYDIFARFHTSIMNKEERIYKVAAFTKSVVVFASNHGDGDWLTQVRDYSNDAKYDDAADSFANAVLRSGVIKERLKH
jgi:hypothetical protein